MKTNNYPDWVEKHHVAGTTIKKMKDNYYLYSSTSKYIKGKSYPVSIQRYLGKITKDGVIKPNTISFIPLKDSLVLLVDEFDISDIDEKDKEILSKVCLLKQSSLYYLGKCDAKTLKVLDKYFILDDGILVKRDWLNILHSLDWKSFLSALKLGIVSA